MSLVHVDVIPPQIEIFNLIPTDKSDRRILDWHPVNSTRANIRMSGESQVFEFPVDSLIYDMVYIFMKQALKPTDADLIDRTDRLQNVYTAYDIYRHMGDGYMLCSLNEPIFLDRYKIPSFLAISKYTKCTEPLCGRKHELKEGAIETILGPRPTRSADRPKPAPSAAEPASKPRKDKPEKVKEPPLPELPLPEPAPRLTMQQRARAAREEAANTALQLSLEAQANDEKVRRSPKSRSPKGTARKSFFGGKKKKYTRKASK